MFHKDVSTHVEDGKITLFEFSIDFAEFEFSVISKIEGGKIAYKLLARLNSFDNAISPIWKAKLQQPILSMLRI